MGWIDKFKSRVFKDDSFDLSNKEKAELNEMIRLRRLELIADKKMRDLEKKYAPKKSYKEVMADFKAFRDRNLARRKANLKRTEIKRKKYKMNEAKRKSVKLRPKRYTRLKP